MRTQSHPSAKGPTGTPVDYSIKLTRIGSDGLRADVRGSRTLATTIAYWEAIVDHVTQQRPGWLLVHDELRGNELSAAEWKKLVEAMSGRGLEGVRIAHVKPFGLDHIEYCEIYAREAGLDARAFADEGVAERWLRYGSADVN